MGISQPWPSNTPRKLLSELVIVIQGWREAVETTVDVQSDLRCTWVLAKKKTLWLVGFFFLQFSLKISNLGTLLSQILIIITNYYMEMYHIYPYESVLLFKKVPYVDVYGLTTNRTFSFQRKKKPPYSSVLKFMTFQRRRLPCLCLGNNFLFCKNLNMFWILCYAKLKWSSLLENIFWGRFIGEQVGLKLCFFSQKRRRAAFHCIKKTV